ncbi:hypothetical protein KM799_02960 [Clostridium tyrobutyricum]|uniref:hypothetical protein n=1 Tax=Clostridium tyrobutyricum TaxID=1519 RepID=UPI0003053C62|nr:hypothetical protein [Clostridium tyrobutyricum]MBV4445563.1 hypothetical protein [Clostridium tyrobutyricum]MEA5007467.1 hypothetical protein [Clostridium tyrobutyricum]
MRIQGTNAAYKYVILSFIRPNTLIECKGTAGSGDCTVQAENTQLKQKLTTIQSTAGTVTAK